MVKLVVSDLDGTLIDSSEQLTDTAREMARWLKDRNVLFTFATGRVQGMTERYAQDMQVSIPYVATNGAALIAPDGVLFRRKVPLKPLETMLRKADIEERSVSKVSLMPVGVLNKLTEEEIFDLIAYVYAKGNKNHDLFKGHAGHKH